MSDYGQNDTLSFLTCTNIITAIAINVFHILECTHSCKRVLLCYVLCLTRFLKTLQHFKPCGLCANLSFLYLYPSASSITSFTRIFNYR